MTDPTNDLDERAHNRDLLAGVDPETAPESTHPRTRGVEDE